MDYLAGQDATILVLFRLQGQPIIPSVATYTLYDTDGSVLLADQPITLGPTTTQVLIVVDDSLNLISTDFEKRTLLIKYTYQSRPYTHRLVYRLTPFLNFTVTPADVRNYLGVNESELTDEQIDIVDAYFQIVSFLVNNLNQSEIEVAQLVTDALSSGDQAEIQINKAILYRTALNIIPSLQLRVSQSEKDGAIGFSRPVIKDFTQLRADTEALLGYALNIVFEFPAGAYILAVLGERPDVITGA